MREILQDFQEKIKRLVRHDQTYLTLLVVAVGGIAFALGALSAEKPVTTQGIITIQATTSPEKALVHMAEAGKMYAATIAATSSKMGAFAGSKTGKVYYPTGCASVNRIKAENRIYFATVAEAEGSGRTRSAQCR